MTNETTEKTTKTPRRQEKGFVFGRFLGVLAPWWFKIELFSGRE
jgi:hypothetical protein